MAYSGAEDIRQYLPRAVIIEGENPTPDPWDPRPEGLTSNDLAAYIAQSDRLIDAMVGSIYTTPLQKKNMGGELVYPPPIQEISAIYTAYMIFQQRLSGSEKAAGEFTEKMYNWAENELRKIMLRHYELFGQDQLFGSTTFKFDLLSTRHGKQAPELRN